MELERTSRFSSKIDLAPLVDVVFLLLIFFLLTSVYVVPAAVELDLPVSATAETPPPAAISIDVDAQRRISVNGDPVSLAALRATVARLLRVDVEKQIALDVDASVNIQALLEVMDALRAAGGTSIAIGTRPKI